MQSQILALQIEGLEKDSDIASLQAKYLRKGSKLEAQVTTLEAQGINLEDQETELEAHSARLVALEAVIEEIKIKIKQSEAKKPRLLESNLIVRLIDKISELQGKPLARGNNDGTHSITRYEQCAADLRNDTPAAKAKWTKVTGLKPKYMRTIKKLTRYRKYWNEPAHETDYDFARLLLSDRYRELPQRAHFGPLLEYVHKSSTLDNLAEMHPDFKAGFDPADDIDTDEGETWSHRSAWSPSFGRLELWLAKSLTLYLYIGVSDYYETEMLSLYKTNRPKDNSPIEKHSGRR